IEAATAPQVPSRAAASTTGIRYSGDASATPTVCSRIAMITVATAPTAATTATRIASGRSVRVVGRGIAGEGGTGAAMARVPLGLDVAAGELLEQPVDRVEERLRDVPRQRVTDRVLRAVGGAGTHRGPTELDDLVVPQPVGKRLEVPEPAVMPA